MENGTSEKKVIFIQFLLAMLIIASYLSNRYVSLLAALFGFFYILLEKDGHSSIALLLFILPFSGVFNIADGTTSLFMFFRIACVIKLLFRYKMPRRYFILLLFFISYSLLSMVVGNTSGISRIINLVLWFLVGLSVVIFYDENRIQCWTRAIAHGTIFSGVVGLHLTLIPNLRNSIAVSSYLSKYSGIVVSRFSGLWNDPNGFTVFIIASMFLCLLAFNSKHLRGAEFYIYERVLSVFGLLALSKSCMLLLVVFWAYLFLSKSQISIIQKITVLLMGIIALFWVNRKMTGTVAEMIGRFTSATSSKDLTTGRSNLWNMYLEDMDVFTWIFGKGINTDLPNGRAAHNTIIQVIYNIGIIGTIMWLGLFIEQGRIASSINTSTKRLWIPIIALLVTMLFLDGMFLEFYYILIPTILCTSYFQNEGEGERRRKTDATKRVT